MLYLSDLDFTLLRSDTSLGDYTRDVWNEAVREGVRLSVATARSFTGVRELLDGLELREPLVLLDGALIVSPEGEILASATLDADRSALALSIGERAGVSPLIVALEEDGSEAFYYPASLNTCQTRLIETMRNRRRVFSHERYGPQPRTLKMVFMGDEAPMQALEAALHEAFGGAIETKRSLDPYFDCWFLTLMHPHGDKAHALTKLETLAGISPNETTVFGDSHNDLGMFKTAGYAVAVANAIEPLKQIADRVLPHTNDEEGVARFLQEEAIVKN
jgi:Cof subfamily protein (haloacid dehalogenase superfamily)